MLQPQPHTGAFPLNYAPGQRVALVLFQKWLVNHKKCALFLDEVEFLGHIVSSEGIKVTHDKTEAVKSWPKFKTVPDVQAFLGLANFYRRLIKGFAGIARPLTDLTRKDVPFQWSHE